MAFFFSKIKTGNQLDTVDVVIIGVILPNHHARWFGHYSDVQVTLWRARAIFNHYTQWQWVCPQIFFITFSPPKVLEPNVLRDDDFTVREAVSPAGRVVLSVYLADQRFLQEDAEAHVVARDAAVHTKVATNIDVIDKRDDVPLDICGEVWELTPSHITTNTSALQRYSFP